MKGLSPILATVLLILIAIATGIVVYAFATGWIGGRLNEGSGPQAVLVVETGYWNSTNSSFVLYVRNDEGVTAKIVRAYIKDPNGNTYYVGADRIAPAPVNLTLTPANGVVVPPGNVNRTVIYYPPTLTVQKGYTYKITLVAEDGTEVTYTIRA